MSAAEIILFVLSLVIIVVVLLQSGKSQGASSAVMGGNQMNIFTRTKERGADKIMTIITAVLAVAFFVVAIIAGRV